MNDSGMGSIFCESRIWGGRDGEKRVSSVKGSHVSVEWEHPSVLSNIRPRGLKIGGRSGVAWLIWTDWSYAWIKRGALGDLQTHKPRHSGEVKRKRKTGQR